MLPTANNVLQKHLEAAKKAGQPFTQKLICAAMTDYAEQVAQERATGMFEWGFEDYTMVDRATVGARFEPSWDKNRSGDPTRWAQTVDVYNRYMDWLKNPPIPVEEFDENTTS